MTVNHAIFIEHFYYSVVASIQHIKSCSMKYGNRPRRLKFNSVVHQCSPRHWDGKRKVEKILYIVASTDSDAIIYIMLGEKC